VIAVVDPATGVRQATHNLPGDPRQMVVTDDGSTLYTFLYDSLRVEQLSLPAFGSAMLFVTERNATATPGYVVPMPGAANTIAATSVSVTDSLVRAVAIWVNGARVAGQADSTDGPIVFDRTRSLLWARRTDGSLARISLSAGRIVADTAYPGITIGAGTRRLHVSASTLFSDVGDIVDIQGAPVQLQQGGPTSGIHAVAIDETAGRYFTLEDLSVGIFDLNSLTRLGTIQLPVEPDGSNVLVRWGTDGLAYVARDLVMLRDRQVGP